MNLLTKIKMEIAYKKMYTQRKLNNKIRNYISNKLNTLGNIPVFKNI